MADNRMIRLAEDLAKSSGELWSYILAAQLPAGVETRRDAATPPRGGNYDSVDSPEP